MFEKDKRCIVRCSAKTADAEIFPFELLKTGNSRTGEHDLVILVLHCGNEHEAVAREVRLHDCADVDDRRIAARQCLGCNLAAPQEYGLDLEAVLIEESHLFGHPNIALPETERWITDSDFFKRLGTGRSRGKGADKRADDTKRGD